MHEELVSQLAPVPGERWLDLGSGTGAIALRAARAGADVVGSDLAPELIKTAKQRAADEGLDVTFEVADCEALPYDDASFDVVSSSVGVIFAPDHQAVASELARVTRPGGRVGLTAWRLDSGVGQMFQAMRPFQPPPPDGAGSPFQWSDEDYATTMLGDAFDLRFVEANSPDSGETGQAMWELFATDYGPSYTLASSLEAERRAELDATMSEFFESFRDGSDGIVQPRLYLLILGTRLAS
jgi:SAM-dependent methyltransferase